MSVTRNRKWVVTLNHSLVLMSQAELCFLNSPSFQATSRVIRIEQESSGRHNYTPFLKKIPHPNQGGQLSQDYIKGYCPTLIIIDCFQM